MPVPQTFDMKDAVPLTAQAPAQFDMSGAVPLTDDLTANDSGQGTYHMKDKKGTSLYVPYGHVNAASKAGFIMTDTDRERYVNDAAADPDKTDNVPTARPSPADVIASAKQKKAINTNPAADKTPNGVSVIGRNSAGEPILSPTDPMTGKGGPARRFLSSAVDAVTSAGKGFASLVNPNPTDEEKAAGETRPIDDFLRIPQRAIIDPINAMSDRAYQDFKEGKTSEGIGHELAAATPLVGPWAAQVAEQVGQQTGSRNVAGAAGTLAGNAVVYAAPHMVGKAIEGVKKIPNAVRNASGLEATKDLVEETQEKNKDIAEKAKQDTATNAEKYKTDKAVADQKVTLQKQAHEAEVKQAAEDDKKALQEHEQAVQVTDAANDAKIAAYKDKENAVEELNAAKKDAHEADKAKVQELEKAAKDQESKRGQTARTVIQQSNRLVERIKSIRDKWKDSSSLQHTKGYKPAGILDRSFNDIREATADQVGSQQDLANAVIKANGKITGSAENIKIFRDILSKNPEEDPEFVTTVQGGREMTYAKGHPLYDVLREGQADEAAEPPKWRDLQGYYTELGTALSKGDLPNDVFLALRSLQNDIGDQMQAMADRAHVGAKWKLTRAQYRDYMQTFRESAGPNHSGSPISQSLDAKDPAWAIKPLTSDATAQRVRNDLTRFDPPVAGQGGAAQLFDNLRAANREYDSLGHAIKVPEAPKPPELKDTPDYPGLKDRPIPPKETKVKAPKPIEMPIEPKEVKPQIIKASIEDLQKAKLDALKKGSKWVRYRGRWIATSAIIGRVIYEGIHGRWVDAADATAAGVAAYALTGKLADILEKPSVKKFFEKPTPEEIKEFYKLPPEQRQELADAMKPALDEAQKKGIKVSPLMSALIMAPVATRLSTVHELKQEALRRNPNAVRVKAPDGSTHVFADQQSANNFKKEIGVR